MAIHCVEEEAIAVAAGVLYQNRRSKFVDRIEHCSEGTPLLVNAVQKSGAAVVTNPGFVYHHGAAYRENVEQRLLPHLYPAGALHRAGVAVAFGSDAPVIDPNPWKNNIQRCYSPRIGSPPTVQWLRRRAGGGNTGSVANVH